jgi:predicted RNase H-like HicB family nuclease
MGTQVLEYTVILRWGPDFQGYWVEVPALPGCVSQGKTKDEALKNVREAIELHVETMREDGLEIPQEESAKVVVEV